MPLDVVCVMGGLAFVGIWVSTWLDSLEARRQRESYDPDDQPAHLGIQIERYKGSGRKVVVVEHKKRKGRGKAA